MGLFYNVSAYFDSCTPIEEKPIIPSFVGPWGIQPLKDEGKSSFYISLKAMT
jgi:hypothetical protein